MATRDPSAQEFLIESNVVERRSNNRAQLLACLACRWSKNPEDPQAYGYQIIQCSEIGAGTLYPLLAQLEKADVIKPRFENHQDAIDENRPPRKFITPTDTDLGRNFQTALEVPSVCRLET